ncbi:hypothetical protein MRB53_026033 [Persea americana]|uniref:Uncharacterized protein n=1 Tax=Persea americana TaxID=3435 RepID=A0ACC2LGS2_PERAE|nr:hypothetical protein MRB53_026033 [Persea americana]
MEGMKAKVAISAVLLLLQMASAASDSLPPYTNHTVGGPAGWLFNANSNNPSANYSIWAANQTFNLGDFLVFNTNDNHTVMQTYNETTYNACSADDDYGNQTSVFFTGNGTAAPVTVAVPLTAEGKQFYFSDADDGSECEGGMRFEIVVGHGRGLPPSLNQPPPPPYEEPQPAPDQSGTPPATTTQSESFYRGGSEKVVAGFAWVLVLSWLWFFIVV